MKNQPTREQLAALRAAALGQLPARFAMLRAELSSGLRS